MTDEELAPIRERVERAYRIWHGAYEDWPERMMAQDYFIDGGKLLAEVERLRARLHEAIESREGFIRHATLAAKERYEAAEKANAALLKIAQAMAEGKLAENDDYGTTYCPFCAAVQQTERIPGKLGYTLIPVEHTAVCPVTKARTLLADEASHES